VSRERWLDEALEASDRALFARRARALPSPSVPELGAILAATDARPRRSPGVPAHAGVLIVLSLAAAASVLGVLAASALAAHEHGARAILPDDGDASVSLVGGWTSYDPAICEPGAEDPGAGETCAAVPASLVVASSEGIPRACEEPTQPPRQADDFALACSKREPEMSSP
jgi:hypothetical protein